MNARRVVLALASLLLLTLSVPAFASPRIVRLSYVAGDVRIDRNKAAGVEQAILNMPVVEGTRIYSVGDDARLEIEFENGSTMRLFGNAEIAFRQLGSIDNGDKQSVVEMVKGTAYFDVKNHNGDDFRVMLHDRDVTVRKSSHFRIQLEEPETTVAVFNGELELEGQAERVLVKKNETLSLQSDDHSRYFLSRQITTMEGDSFDVERSQYIASQVRSNAYQYAGVAYGEPYSYGISDLAYYGSYAYYPGYGYLWRPAGFGIGWDPFGYGAWTYYNGPGWVFVSSYPWGWTPFRYGRWVNIPGRGWCWGPYGGYHRGWYPVPVVIGYGRGGRIERGHGPIPVPWVHPPQVHGGGRTVAFGGGGYQPHRDGRDGFGANRGPGYNGRNDIEANRGPNGFSRPGRADVPNQANGQIGRQGRGDERIGQQPGQFSRPGRADDFSRGGRTTNSGAVTPGGSAVTPQSGAITVQGGSLTTPGGAITTPGGAVRPVTPGMNNGETQQAMRDYARDANLNDRQGNGHRTVQGWQAPPVSTPAATSVTTPTQTPAVTREPRSFERNAVRDTPGERMSAPPVTAPVQRQSVSSAPAVTTTIQRPSTPAISSPAMSAPPVSSPMQHQSAPPVTAPIQRPSAAPPASAPRPAPAVAPVRSQQSSHMSAPMMRGGGGSGSSMGSRSSGNGFASRGGGGGGGSHFSGGGSSHSSGGGSSSGGGHRGH